MAAHQAAKISNDQKACHDITIKRIGKYLLGSLDKGFMNETDVSKELQVHADADFAGGFDDHSSACSKTGCVTKHAG